MARTALEEIRDMFAAIVLGIVGPVEGISEALDGIAEAVDQPGNTLTKTVSGSLVTVTDAFAAKAVEIDIDGASDQALTPTVSTPVPITSIDSVTLLVAGANQIDPSTFIDQGAGPNTITDDGYISQRDRSGDARSWSYDKCNYKGIVLPAGTYTISFDKLSGTRVDAGYCVYKSDGTVLVDKKNTPSFTAETITLSEETTIGVMVKVYDSVVAAKLEIGSSATAYTPYTAGIMQFPIDLGGNKLRGLSDGTCDDIVIARDGTVTLVKRVEEVVLDGSSTIWSASDGSMRVVVAGSRFVAANDDVQYFLTSHFTAATHRTAGLNNEVGTAAFWANVPIASQRRITLNTGLSSVTDKDSALAWLSSNPVTVVYPLDTPVTIELGRVDIGKLPGPGVTIHAITTPSTSVSLDYERDINIVISAIEAA